MKPRIVIVGAGFGGLFAAKRLARESVDVILIDRLNYHLFQPLLYQVATAALAPSDIAWPIRSVLSRKKNVTVLLANVTGIDHGGQRVLLENSSVDYDYLILATGSRDAFFGHDEWENWTQGLKTVNDATALRRKLLLAFEEAEMCEDAVERERLLRFVIVGAGPTGVELAGSIAELARYTLARDFRRIDPRSAQVILVEGGDRVLPSFSPKSSRYAQTALERLGVDVRVNTMVTDCDAEGVVVGGKRMPAATVLWAAGVTASPIAEWTGASSDKQGRVPVEDDLSLARSPNVFVIGDAASTTDPNGRQVPGIAPAAKQQGRYAASVIASRLGSRSDPGPFRYRHAGDLATIGRRAAVAEFGKLRLKGRLAWWLWGIAHIYFLIGIPSPVIVSIRWLWQYVTYGRGARLITSNTDGL